MSSKNSRLLIPAVFVSLIMSSCSFVTENSESATSSEGISETISSVSDTRGESSNSVASSDSSITSASASSSLSISSNKSEASSSSAPNSSSAPSSSSSSASSSEASESSSSVPVHEHTFETGWDGDENNHWHNATCGHDVRSEEGPHNYVAGTVVPPTYEADGYTIYTCSICGREKRGDIVTKLTHNYSTEWSSDAEKHWHACTDAGWEHLQTDVGDHQFTDEVVEPNYETGGYTEHTCTICGHAYRDNLADPLVHIYSDSWTIDEEAGTHYHKCTDSGFENSLRADEAEHTYDEWVIDNEATIGGTGSKHADCTVCGHRITSTIPALAEFEGDFGYILLNDGTGYSVFAANKAISGNDGNVVLPSEHKGLPVKGIGTAPGIADFTVDEEYTSLTPPSFQDCVNITSVNIPDSYEFIGDYAFEGCAFLTNAEIPQNIKYVGTAAFANCTSLETIYLDIVSLKTEETLDADSGRGVTWFPYATFVVNAVPQEVYSLRNITLIIGEHCDIDLFFMAALHEAGFVFHHNLGGENQYTSGSTIDEIADIVVEDGNPFVTFENSVLYRNDETEIAFVVVPQLSEANRLKIKDSVEHLDFEMFQFLDSLLLFEIDESSSAYYIGSAQNPYKFLVTFSGDDSVTSFSVPDGCKYIYELCRFEYLENLVSVSIPASVISLPSSLFADCSSLESISVSPDNPNYSSSDGVLFDKGMTKIICCPSAKSSFTFPSTVTTITSPSFYKSSITSIIIPEGVVSIARGSFSKCSNLETVVIPSSITDLPESFAECESLKNVKILNPNTTVDKNAFARCTNIERFEGTLEQWLSIEHGFDGYNIPMCGLNIHLYLNGSDEESTSIDVAIDVASLCAEDFNGFVSLESINVSPDNPNYASSDGVLFNKGLTEIISCPRAKTSITLPNSVTTIGEEAFYRSSLVSIILPSGVTTVGSSAFYYCSSLESITIPSTVTSFDARFSGCTSLTTINYGGTINQWRELCPGQLFSPFEPGPESVVVHCADGDITLVNRFI